MAQAVNALFGALVLGMFAGCIVLWWNGLRKLALGEPLLAIEQRRLVPWGLVDVIVIFVIVVVTLVGGQTLAYYLFDVPFDRAAEDASVNHLAVAIFSSSVSLLAACALSVLLLIVRGASARDLGWQARRFWGDIRLGVAAFVMLAPPMYFMQFLLTRLWPSEHPLQTMLLESPQWSIILGATFTAVIVAPLTEEIFFRLIFQGWLEKALTPAGKVLHGDYAFGKPGAENLESDVTSAFLGDQTSQKLKGNPPDELGYHAPEREVSDIENRTHAEGNPYLSPPSDVVTPVYSPEFPVSESNSVAPLLAGIVATIISAAVFAALHWGHGPDPIPLFFLALGLGYLYHRTHRIVPCIVVHFLINGLSMLAMILFLLSGQEPP